jgi:hypothetical protein
MLVERSILRGKPDKGKVSRSTKQEVECSLAMSQKRDTLSILKLIAGKRCTGGLLLFLGVIVLGMLLPLMLYWWRGWLGGA